MTKVIRLPHAAVGRRDFFRMLAGGAAAVALATAIHGPSRRLSGEQIDELAQAVAGAAFSGLLAGLRAARTTGNLLDAPIRMQRAWDSAVAEIDRRHPHDADAILRRAQDFIGEGIDALDAASA